MERLFGTVCSRFSKWFASYTGTLTGSKTDAKRHKDVEGMLERGELLTMEEFYEVWTEWKELHYNGSLDEVFSGFVAKEYDGGAYINEVNLKDEMLLLEETIINDTFLNTTPQEMISFFLSKSLFKIF